MRRLFPLLLILLSGCQTASSPPPTANVTDEAMFADARQAVLAILKDPDSAKFGPGMTRKAKNGGWKNEPTDVVCGTVNSKNSFGGYTGMALFAYVVAEQRAYIAQGSSMDMLIPQTWCL